ncbi:PREDICTED: cadherin-related family member 5 [Elephantulus edwardii]|uniref:cadherin-related family member 5 n=1 Tax=Elephantulus edwardii TaxID=28737 RepID=UPI0003F09928|nr:PREDICTED: cadherin-related family member 5 [Elephantulus edwardii]
MRAETLLRPLLLPLLLGLLCGPWRTQAQAQACSVSNNHVEVEENQNITKPLVTISVPEGQRVTLKALPTSSAFQIRENKLFLIIIPDYEVQWMPGGFSMGPRDQWLEAHIECWRGDSMVTQLLVIVSVNDVNDNAPFFPFNITTLNVSEDAKINSVVIPATELEAQDPDQTDTSLFYTLQEVTPGASDFFSLLSPTNPSLKLDKRLDFDKCPSMTFRLLARDTQEENVTPSHTATATLTLRILPADLRPPWFLPCSYSDGFVCIQAKYEGAVPTGQILPDPLTLRPGPIYAVDGDSGISQPIIYSIVTGNQDGVFFIDADSGNLTVTTSIPRPTTFQLVVRAEQVDNADRYSVTTLLVKALATAGSPPRFPQSLYRGTTALGLGIGAVIKNASNPSEPLRVQAQDPDFPDFNSAITYNVTNSSVFRMEGETMVTRVAVEAEGVFYVEVEAKNMGTSARVTTVVEIQVQEQVSTPGPFTSPTPSEAGRTTSISSSTTMEGSRPPGPTQEPSPGPPPTGSGGSTGPPPPSGTTLRPAASTTVGGHPSVGTSRPLPPATPSSGSSESTPELGPSPPIPPKPTGPPGPSQGPPTSSSGGGTGPHPPSGTSVRPPVSTTRGETPSGGASTSSSPGTPSGGGSALTTELRPSQPTTSSSSTSPGSSGPPGSGEGSTAGGDGPGGGDTEEQGFSVVEMAAVGGVLGAVLLLALLALAVLIHKHYRHKFKCCCGKAQDTLPLVFDNPVLQTDSEANWAPAPSPPPPEASPPPPELQPPAPASLGHARQAAPSPEPLSPGAPNPAATAAAPAGSSPTAVRSILTKDRRAEGGYKAVWFGEDIGAEADVVVLNAPTLDDGDTGSENSDDDDTGPAEADSTYI